ncbi:hypothetical protein N7516_002533 [Penicillium verrucosum]|uniref:uncharacterized protein n=1 Tax=Penicillium verrucosum TaxID=60171 RepID=UPI0025458139|nr:uncharacterized protein N7516_002533 [Penicillium verrucosum]KAJ5942365.1 hypothetical protein N7516_002533 [Penicillium verrucosum]
MYKNNRLCFISISLSSNIRWSRRTLDVAMSGQGVEDSVSQEQLVVGDENGCRATTYDVGTSKAGSSTAQTATARVPDLVMLNANSAIKVVGEIKTPWPLSHIEMLSLGVDLFERGNGDWLRHILGQSITLDNNTRIHDVFIDDFFPS